MKTSKNCAICSGMTNLKTHYKDGNEKNKNKNNLTILCSTCLFKVEHMRTNNNKKEVVCKCGYSWLYSGISYYATCPRCYTKVKLK